MLITLENSPMKTRQFCLTFEIYKLYLKCKVIFLSLASLTGIPISSESELTYCEKVSSIVLYKTTFVHKTF